MPYKLFYGQLEQRVKELQREAVDRNLYFTAVFLKGLEHGREKDISGI